MSQALPVITTVERQSRSMTDADLAMARRHIENAEQRVGNQRQLVAILAVRRQPLSQAREVLGLLEETLRVQTERLVDLENWARRLGRSRRTAGTRAAHREVADR